LTWETSASDLANSLGGYGWVALALTAVLLHFFLLSITFMLSKGFNITDLYRWTKSELAQALASLILIGLIFSVTASESAGISMIQDRVELASGAILMPGASGAASIEVRANPFVASYAFLRNMAECVKVKYLEQYKINKRNERAVSMSIGLIIAGIDIPIQFKLILFSAYQNMVLAQYLANNYTWLALAVYFQIHFLQWIEASMFTVYLPLGIILRILPWTRGAGGLLIALAIGLYLVYPMMFVFLIANSGGAPSGCTPLQFDVQKTLCVTEPASFVDLIESAKAEASLGTGTLGGNASSMIVFGYFYPLTLLVVVFAFVRSLAPFLGADIAEMGRGLFRMI
jgi:hypothetical protein